VSSCKGPFPRSVHTARSLVSVSRVFILLQGEPDHMATKGAAPLLAQQNQMNGRENFSASKTASGPVNSSHYRRKTREIATKMLSDEDVHHLISLYQSDSLVVCVVSCLQQDNSPGCHNEENSRSNG